MTYQMKVSAVIALINYSDNTPRAMAMSDPMAYLGISRRIFFLCSLLMLAALWPASAVTDNKTSAADPASLEFIDSPLTVNDSTIDSAISRYSPLVLDCWEEGCEPCELISPTIDEMAQDFKGRVVFGRLNTGQNHKTRFKYHIYHYPMLLIFKNGSLLYKHLGNYPKATLEDMILQKIGIG